MKNEKRVLLYNCKESARSAKQSESDGVSKLKKIKVLVNKTLGPDLKKFDIFILLEVGIDYLIDFYTKNYLSNLPKHIPTKDIIEKQTNVSMDDLSVLISEYHNAIAPLTLLNAKPLVNSAGDSLSELSPDCFNKYLEPSKLEYYNYLKALVPMVLKIDTITNIPTNHSLISKWVKFKGLTCWGTKDLSIDLKFFTVKWS